MFWFKKKTHDEENTVSEAEKEETASNMEEETVIDVEQDVEEEFFDEEDIDADDGSEDEHEPEEIPELTVKLESLDDMAEFMNGRRSDGMQFMKKDTREAFEIRERHLRLARVWGSVSMSRECPPDEYGRIMLAIEILQSPDEYYVLPRLEDKILKIKIQEFCEQKYGMDGKKYSRSPEKFAELLKENGDIPEWKSFSKEAMYDLSAEFCEKNGIDFSDLEE